MWKRYVLWDCICSPNRNLHCNTNNYWADNQEWTFEETAFTDWVMTYIWVLDSTVAIPTTDFNIVEKTEQQINDLLLLWYPWGEVTASNYLFTDLRPTNI